MAPGRCKKRTLDSHADARQYWTSFECDDALEEQYEAGKRGVMAVMRAVIREREKVRK